MFFYEIRSPDICTKIKGFNRVNENNGTFWKYFWNIWNFKLLLTEDDSALKVASKITFRGLVAYRTVAYIKKCIPFTESFSNLSRIS